MTESVDPPAYWFPAKKYGWGWGVPTRWPGVVALVAFVVLMAANAFVFPPASHPVAFFGGTALLSIGLLLLCLLKGEPPAWRWGK